MDETLPQPSESTPSSPEVPAPKWTCRAVLPESTVPAVSGAPSNESPTEPSVLDQILGTLGLGSGAAAPKDNTELPAGLTVGSKFHVECEGEPAALVREGLHFKMPEESRYALRILEVPTLSETGARLVVTSHVAGDFRFEDLTLASGEARVQIPELAWTVQSVINPQENAEPEPYGPTPALSIAWPAWVWIALAAALVLTGMLVLVRLRRYLQRKRLFDELAQHNTALSPFNQFSKDLRTMSRQYPMTGTEGWTPDVTAKYVEDLNTNFRLFLVRELRVPAQKWSSGSVLRDLRRRNSRFFNSAGRDLQLALRELDKAVENRQQLSMVDGQQLSELCRKTAEHVWKVHAAAQRGGRR